MIVGKGEGRNIKQKQNKNIIHVVNCPDVLRAFSASIRLHYVCTPTSTPIIAVRASFETVGYKFSATRSCEHKHVLYRHKYCDPIVHYHTKDLCYLH